MKIPSARVVLSEQDIDDYLEGARNVLRSGRLILGRRTEEFESRFAALHGCASAIAVGSGTAALEIILRALDVAGKTVVVPANTFYATAAAVLHAQARPKFADVSTTTMMPTQTSVAEAIDAQTVAVIMVHIGGMISPDLLAIEAYCAARGIALIEDAAHAHGSSVAGRCAGTIGRAGAFSFYPTKLVTSGEGGMILTNSREIAQEAVLYRDQGKAAFDTNLHVRLGYNWRISELHAILGLVQLRHMNDWIEKKREIAKLYDEALSRMEGITAIAEPPRVRSNYHKYMAMLDPEIVRAELRSSLKADGVSLGGEVYDTPLDQQPVLHAYADRHLPNAELVCSQHICLPIFSDMSLTEAEYVADKLAARLKTKRVRYAGAV